MRPVRGKLAQVEIQVGEEDQREGWGMSGLPHGHRNHQVRNFGCELPSNHPKREIYFISFVGGGQGKETQPQTTGSPGEIPSSWS